MADPDADVPSDWSTQGPVFYVNCMLSGRRKNPSCNSLQQAPHNPGQGFYEWLLSGPNSQYPDISSESSTGTLSQTVRGLTPGYAYHFETSLSFNDGYPCTVSYTLDGVPFRTYAAPVDPSQTSGISFVEDETQFVATATTQTMSVTITCPNSGSNGGIIYARAINAYGPI